MPSAFAPLPKMPPVAPLAAMRVSATSAVTHEGEDTDGLATKGRKKHDVFGFALAVQLPMLAKAPLAHCMISP